MTLMSSDSGARAITLRVDGKPMGWQRARISTRGKRPRHFNDPKTDRAEANYILAWIAAGQPRLPDVALDLRVEAVLCRPQAHYRRDGNLSAAGERSPYPTKKPDFDNIAKVVGDALNGKAYRDDAYIARASVIKRWANPGEHEHTTVRLVPLPVPGITQEAA